MTFLTSHRNAAPVFNDLFDAFLNPQPTGLKRNNYAAKNSTLPAVNISENENGYQLALAAPGLKKEDFKIELDQQLLTLSAEPAKEELPEGVKYTRKEFAYKAFSRVFTLPEKADLDKINANYENGILTISIPKKEEAKPQAPKSIEIV